MFIWLFISLLVLSEVSPCIGYQRVALPGLSCCYFSQYHSARWSVGASEPCFMFLYYQMIYYFQMKTQSKSQYNSKQGGLICVDQQLMGCCFRKWTVFECHGDEQCCLLPLALAENQNLDFQMSCDRKTGFVHQGLPKVCVWLLGTVSMSSFLYNLRLGEQKEKLQGQENAQGVQKVCCLTNPKCTQRECVCFFIKNVTKYQLGLVTKLFRVFKCLDDGQSQKGERLFRMPQGG